VFLECPYYSITRFNKFKITNSNSKTGTNKYYQRNAIAASRADKQVCCSVDYFNDHLRLINRNCGVFDAISVANSITLYNHSLANALTGCMPSEYTFQFFQ
jgi:hypothetical protein